MGPDATRQRVCRLSTLPGGETPVTATLPETYAQGTPTAAYGRFCHADVDELSDNQSLDALAPEYGLKYASDLPGVGFDGVWRKCPLVEHYHTGDQDVEKVSGGYRISVHSQPNMNIACSGNDSQDKGNFKVWVSDQVTPNLTLDFDNIKVQPLTAAPRLHVVNQNGVAVGPGIAPFAVAVSTSPLGVPALELRYNRCPDVSAAVDAVYDAPSSPVPFAVQGEISGTTNALAVQFTGPFNVNINW